jgi:outer membrane protein assembly factor BamB
VYEGPELPSRWSATENVTWKVAIPGESWSSPIVQGDRVFLTTATNEGTSCHVICIDRASGEVLWDKEVFQQTPLRKEQRNSYATPTPVTDGQHVWAVFADGSVVCLTVGGEVVWTNRNFDFYSQHGLGASPMLYGRMLLMPYDASSRGEDKKVGWQTPWDESYLAALDAATGEIIWKADRGMSRIAHISPIRIEVGGQEQILSDAGDVVQAFDPASGQRLWTVRSEGEGVVPTPVVGDGLIFTASGFGDPAIRAVRPPDPVSGQPARIVWEQKRSVPMIPSMVYANDLLFTVSERGIAMCVDPTTGEPIWQDRLEGPHSPSPIVDGGRIYILSEQGETSILAAEREFRVLARNAIGERCQASPAASDGQLFIRTADYLYCIGQRQSDADAAP